MSGTTLGKGCTGPTLGSVSVLLLTDARLVDHETGQHHPESPARLAAVIDALAEASLDEALVHVVPEPAPFERIVAAHSAAMVNLVERRCSTGGHLDADTAVVPASWQAAQLAAGAGLTAAARLEAGEGDAAFCAVRPPGHHATREVSMGFCLLNNVAVTAMHLVERGERVAIVDFDAHHGNGTQDVFYADERVLFVSWHQWPLYPGTGRVEETGAGSAAGSTVNIPLPPGATGDLYLRSLDELVVAKIERFAPTWLLLSAGFDSHRADPLGGLGLTTGDYVGILRRLLVLVPRGRAIAFLEGGYNLQALGACSATLVATLAGERFPTEAPTSGGPGAAAVERAIETHREWLA